MFDEYYKLLDENGKVVGYLRIDSHAGLFFATDGFLWIARLRFSNTAKGLRVDSPELAHSRIYKTLEKCSKDEILKIAQGMVS